MAFGRCALEGRGKNDLGLNQRFFFHRVTCKLLASLCGHSFVLAFLSFFQLVITMLFERAQALLEAIKLRFREAYPMRC